MPPIEAREYQDEAIDAVMSHFSHGIFSVIAHLATGLGKSLIEQELVKRHFPIETHRTLLIGGISRQLNFQAERGFRNQYPAVQTKVQVGKFLRPGIGLVMGDLNQTDARIIIGSAQTLVEKGDSNQGDPETEPITLDDVMWTLDGGIILKASSKRRFLVSPRFDEILRYGPIDLWEHDEAHHAPADGTLTLVTRLAELYKVLKLPPLRIAGFTATPVRADERALSNVFQKIAYSRGYRWAQDNGFLVPLPLENVYRVLVEGIDERWKSRGRYATKDAHNWAKMIVRAYEEKAPGRTAIAFTGQMGELGGVEASKQLAREFNRAGIPAVHVDGEMWIDTQGHEHPTSTRYTMFEAIMKGRIKVICNFGVMVEGIDLPIVDCILLARKVNEVLFTQIIGRMLRLFRGVPTEGIPPKENALLIDFTGQELVVLTVGTLLGVKVDPKTLKPLPDDKVEEEEILGGTDVRDLRKQGTVMGENNVYNIGKIIQKSSGAWYSDPQTATMSLAVSQVDMLFIHPPHYGTADRASNLLTTMDNLRERTDPEQWRKVTDMLDYCRRVFSNFSLWHVIRDEGSAVLKLPGFIYINIDLPVLEADSIKYAHDHCAVADYIMEKKRWQKQNIPATPPQMDKLRSVMPEGYKLPKSLTKGEASHLITHLLAERSVMKVIQPLLIQMGKLEGKLAGISG